MTGKEAREKIKSGKCQCGCCGKGVGVNSVMCPCCRQWCHLRCSDFRDVRVVKNFTCPAYLGDSKDKKLRGMN